MTTVKVFQNGPSTTVKQEGSSKITKVTVPSNVITTIRTDPVGEVTQVKQVSSPSTKVQQITSDTLTTKVQQVAKTVIQVVNSLGIPAPLKEVYVRDTDPVLDADWTEQDSIWFQTGLGSGDDFEFFFRDPS